MEVTTVTMETSDVTTDIPDLVFNNVKSETICSDDASSYPSTREGIYRSLLLQAYAGWRKTSRNLNYDLYDSI